MQRGVLARRGEEEEEERTPAPRSPLPVFIFPPVLAFYTDDQASHKQVLTLYNPFPRVLRYKVLCTAALRYTVVDAEGLVKPHSCIDIVIRHTDIRPQRYRDSDTFRVEVWEEGGGRGARGRKDITAILRPKKPGAQEQRGRGPQEALAWHQPTRAFSVQRGFPRPLAPGLLALYVLLGSVSLAVLTLPLHGDTRSLLHGNLHVSIAQKLVCAYVLGLLTMVFLQW